MSDWLFAVLIIGALPLSLVIIASIGWLESWVELSNWKRTCPICQQGDGVLLHDNSHLPVYRTTKGWCPPHRERLTRIRQLENELLDLPGPNQYVDGDPVENLVKKVQALDVTIVNTKPVGTWDYTVLNIPVQRSKEDG